MAADCGLAPATSSTAKGNNPAVGPTWSPPLVWPFPPKLAPLALLAVLALAGWLRPAPLFATSSITYMQGNYATPQTSETTVKITFSAAQAGGDLNVVVVGWFDTTAVVSTVTDNSGNTYTRAVGPTCGLVKEARQGFPTTSIVETFLQHADGTCLNGSSSPH